jgi:hypothetical protein
MDYLILVVLILVFLAGFILASSIYTLPARTPPPASTAKSTTIDLPDYDYPPEDFEPPQAWPPPAPDNYSPLTTWPDYKPTDYRPIVLHLAELRNKRQQTRAKALKLAELPKLKCSRCKDTKGQECFYPRAATRRGRQYYCIDCFHTDYLDKTRPITKGRYNSKNAKPKPIYNTATRNSRKRPGLQNPGRTESRHNN